LFAVCPKKREKQEPGCMEEPHLITRQLGDPTDELEKNCVFDTDDLRLFRYPDMNRVSKSAFTRD
jgi:hypothetical protein